MSSITINGVTLDPAEDARALEHAGLASSDASQSDYILIQTHTHLTNEQKEELAKFGVDIHEYVFDNTYLCGYKETDLKQIRSRPYVQWANVYLRGFKVPPNLRGPAADPRTQILPVAAGASSSSTPRTVDILLHENVDTARDNVKTAIARAAGVAEHELLLGRRKVRVTVEEQYIDDLAAIDVVRAVHPTPTRVLCNNVARSILNADVLVNGTPYQGAGQVICVADTGFDLGDINNVHPDFSGRVKKLYFHQNNASVWVAAGPGDEREVEDRDGHGTHVCGSVVGDGLSQSMGRIQGTAPRASLVVQANVPTGGVPIDLADLFITPYRDDGVRVHSNSWTSYGFRYDSTAAEVDDFVWNHPDLVICFGSGNYARDLDKPDGVIDEKPDGIISEDWISGESGAKNAIIVGASENVREDMELTYGKMKIRGQVGYYFSVPPLRDDRMADNPHGLAAFSSRGPAEGGRIKPDVVAPGTAILSTLSRASSDKGNQHGYPEDRAYAFRSGVSMATPLVAGCAAVLRESLVKNGLANPPAALIKALLINGAIGLKGQHTPSETGPTPNCNSGWGRVDLARSVIFPGGAGGIQLGGPLSQGDEDTFTIEVHGSTLRITIAWTDPKGAYLQNNLDLIVKAADGTHRYGNMDPSKPAVPAGTAFWCDDKNNVEQVHWPSIPPGTETIIIRAARITKYPQSYACVWMVTHP